MRARGSGGLLAPLAVLAFLAGGMAHGEESAGVEPATLSVWNRPLVTFREPVGGVPPARRVANARARIAALPPGSAQSAIAAHPGRVGSSEGLMLWVGDQVVFGIVPGDLDPESGATLEQAARQASRRLRELLVAQAAQRDTAATFRGIGYSFLALLAFVVAVRLIVWIREAAIGKLAGLFARGRASIAGIDILPTLESVERATFRVLSWALILGLAYLALTFIFYQFPLTYPLGERLGSYLTGNLLAAGRAIALSLPGLLAVVAVLLVTRAISLWASRLLVEIERGVRVVAWLEREQAKATRRILIGVIWVFGLATAYPLLPWSGSRAFQGMSVVLGLAVSFASGGLINHWISGLMVLYARSFRLGDFVSFGEMEGIVTEMGPLAIKLRNKHHQEITIPNAVIASEKLVNYTRLAAESGVLLAVSVAVGYDVAWQRVHDLLLGAAASTRGIAAGPAPRVLTWELSSFFVRYELHAYLAPGVDLVTARADMNAQILDTFGIAGVQLMTPHFESQPDWRVLPVEAVSTARDSA
jgi:small-conductance mechanosensitive channel